MGHLTRRQVLDAKDIRTIDVQVPEWTNGTGEAVVSVRGLTIGEANEMHEQWKDTAEDDKLILLCCWACVDEQGQRLFTRDDVLALKAKSRQAMERVVRAALDVCGMSGTAAEAAEKKS